VKKLFETIIILVLLNTANDMINLLISNTMIPYFQLLVFRTSLKVNITNHTKYEKLSYREQIIPASD
jgi:hypothetical protein